MLSLYFSDNISYGHSSGKVENKAEAIRNIVNNASVYSDISLDGFDTKVEGGTVVTRYLMTATEKKADGKSNPLKLHILVVWNKDGGTWKMLARQAVRVN